MTALLHLQCSPRKQRSASIEVADNFIARYLQNHPQTEVTTLNVWDMDLPEFDEHAMQAKYAGLSGLPLTTEQERAWKVLTDLAAHLHHTDLLVMSVPLWNYSIPYKLKHFIDLVSQKGILFSFHPEHGLEGMLHNKRAVAVYARGLDFSVQSATPAALFDFQKPYIEAWLAFVGITDVHSVTVEKTIFGEAVDQDSRQQAVLQAKVLADRLS